ncbi:MAG: hypothetical protein BHV76_03150 [Phocaeicola plebeius]|uniref:Uncharacterized protein n=1 Tax=Phocaeicola plebeius TaxID=310297 RepID=A0A854C320_9BACT|nr:MAG: hypothetical protein BHV76_03150 [Phocaeicola plebeius]
MRISWRNLFWKLLTFLISEIDAFSLVLSSGNSERIFHEKAPDFLQTKEAGISAEKPALNLSKIFYRIGYNENATAASF